MSPWAELIEQWLDLRRESLSVTAWEAYAGKARFRLIPGLGDVAVRRLAVRDIDGFYRRLHRDDGMSAATVEQIDNTWAGALDQAVRWGWRADNPARWATLPPDEVRAHIDAAVECGQPRRTLSLQHRWEAGPTCDQRFSRGPSGRWQLLSLIHI